jgi:hypothetical protein
MNTAANQRCAHPACTCTVPVGDALQRALPETRESLTSDQAPGCQCGHPECGAEQPESEKEI